MIKEYNYTNQIIPSILEKDILVVENKIKEYSCLTNNLHIDICDGLYVKNVTWLPDKDAVYDVFANNNLNLEFDMMVTSENLEKYLTIIITFSMEKIILHYDAFENKKDIKRHILFIKDKLSSAEVGIAFKSDQFLNIDHIYNDENIKEAIKYCDYIQIMGISIIGIQGQPLDTRSILSANVLNSYLTKICLKKMIQIDGGINLETIKLFKFVYNLYFGVNNFVVGSFIKNNSDKKLTFDLLSKVF